MRFAQYINQPLLGGGWAGWLLLGLVIAGNAQMTNEDYRVLVFSKTAGYRHPAITNGLAAIQQLGAENRFAVEATEDAAAFNDNNLTRFQAVVFLMTTGDVLDNPQQGAFERYIRAGHGFAGIHSTTDTEYGWPWFGGLVGTYFSSHPALQQAVVRVEDFQHPATTFLPESWPVTDEWHNFQTNPRGAVRVLLNLNEATYSGGTMGDHPISWCHEYDGGRAWFTGLGHPESFYQNTLFRAHLLGGIQYAAGMPDAPPAGALVLFDGSRPTAWEGENTGTNQPVAWQVADGALVVEPGTGDIRTFQTFQDYQLHLEFQVPTNGNSGVYLQNQFEIQIFDSYGKALPGVNDCGAIWGFRAPATNAAAPPGVWQKFDLTFRAARWDGGQKVQHARVSVRWNNVLVQDDIEIPHPTESGAPPETPPPGPIMLQDLGYAVKFRNIWVRPLDKTPDSAPALLVRPGSVWKYLDDGSNPGTAWRNPAFDDAAWPSGYAQLGFGDGDEATLLRSARADTTRIITYYFRKAFLVTNAWMIDNLTLRLLRDDGAIVYLNGLEIFRDNMPMTPADFTTTASSAVNGVQETSFFLAAQLPASALKEGTNVLAVEIHQNQPSSTDVSFDLALTATRFARPDLVVESTQGRPQLVWPALPGGFVLESASTLSADQGRWLEVTNAVTVEQRKRGLLPLNPEQTFQFYRLRKK